MDATDLIDRAHQFALSVNKFYGRLPKTHQAQVPGLQLLRCGRAVSMNYRAARRSRSRAEFIAKLGIVVEEIDAAVGWLEFLHDAQIAADEGLFSEAEQLRRIFGKALVTARKNKAQSR